MVLCVPEPLSPARQAGCWGGVEVQRGGEETRKGWRLATSTARLRGCGLPDGKGNVD